MIARILATLAFYLALQPATAGAEWIFLGDLDGSQVLLPSDSPGAGYADLHYRPETLDLWVHRFIWWDLSSPVVAAHIHCCGVGSAVALSLVGISAGTSGSFEHTWDLSLATSFDPAFLAAHGGTAESARAAFWTGILGGIYADIHTVDHPDGEIGGFGYYFIPEPQASVLLAAGLAALAACQRRATWQDPCGRV